LHLSECHQQRGDDRLAALLDQEVHQRGRLRVGETRLLAPCAEGRVQIGELERCSSSNRSKGNRIHLGRALSGDILGDTLVDPDGQLREGRPDRAGDHHVADFVRDYLPD